LAALSLWVAQAAIGAQYQAMFADGTRIEGNGVSGTSADGAQLKLKLDQTDLLDPNRPLRWLLRDSQVGGPPAVADTGPVVELLGGDRLPGRLLHCQADESERGGAPGEWLAVVETRIGTEWPYGPRPMVRVDCGTLRRVVWDGDTHRRLEPGTLLCRDGRQLRFHNFRWGNDTLELLTEDGLRQVPLSDLAEVRLPRRDPWDCYYNELARLLPGGQGRLVRIQTDDGLLVTASSHWWRPDHGQGSRNWWYVVQPAWCRDPLDVRMATVRVLSSFAPHEVPLSRIEPSRVVQHAILVQGRNWQTDRNVQGGTLGNAARDFAWGFGVHAPCNLWFDLPDAAQAFRTQVGLDRIAGKGGCARGMVCCNDPTEPPLYRSSHLIGSAAAADSGALPLRGPSAGQKSLVLVADAAGDDRPPGADPLDIRDMLDWLEPMLLLDPAKVKAEIDKRRGNLLPAWEGWAASLEGGQSPQAEIQWDESNPADKRFVVTVSTGRRPLLLSLQRPVSQRDGLLEVQLRGIACDLAPARPGVPSPPVARDLAPGRLEVRINGRPIARIEVPVGINPPRFSLPLDRYRGGNAKLELAYLPADERERVQWQVLATTRVHWVPLTQVQVRSLQGATFAQQRDGSILVTRPAPAADTYVLTGRTELPSITGLRLEALPDPSLPGGGPGMWRRGEFLLSQFQAAHARPASPAQRTPIPLADAKGDDPHSYQPVAQALRDTARDDWTGWFIRAGYNEPHAVVFSLKQPVEMKDRLLIVSMAYRCPAQPTAIGRFRILATSDGLPLPADDVPLPLLPEAAP